MMVFLTHESLQGFSVEDAHLISSSLQEMNFILTSFHLKYT